MMEHSDACFTSLGTYSVELTHYRSLMQPPADGPRGTYVAYFELAGKRASPGAESRFSPRRAARICGKAWSAATSPAATISGVLVKSSHTNCFTSGSMMISACVRQARSECRCIMLNERLRMSVSVRGCPRLPDSRYTATTMSAPSKSTPSMGTGAVKKPSTSVLLLGADIVVAVYLESGNLGQPRTL